MVGYVTLYSARYLDGYKLEKQPRHQARIWAVWQQIWTVCSFFGFGSPAHLLMNVMELALTRHDITPRTAARITFPETLCTDPRN